MTEQSRPKIVNPLDLAEFPLLEAFFQTPRESFLGRDVAVELARFFRERLNREIIPLCANGEHTKALRLWSDAMIALRSSGLERDFIFQIKGGISFRVHADDLQTHLRNGEYDELEADFKALKGYLGLAQLPLEF
jgi:hypothetical protein